MKVTRPRRWGPFLPIPRGDGAREYPPHEKEVRSIVPCSYRQRGGGETARSEGSGEEEDRARGAKGVAEGTACDLKHEIYTCIC